MRECQKMILTNHGLVIIKDLIYISKILAFVVGVSNIIWGSITVTIGIGSIGIAFGVIDLWLSYECHRALALLRLERIRELGDKLIVALILGFLFTWLSVGIILLLAYLKYRKLITRIR